MSIHLQPFFEKLINPENNILIFNHKQPDGDTIGATIGLYKWIKQFNPNVKICSSKPIIEENWSSFIKNAYANELESLNEDDFVDFENTDFENQIAIAVDFRDDHRAELPHFFNRCKEQLAIDHHAWTAKEIQAEAFNNPNVINESSVTSTCQLILNLINTIYPEQQVFKNNEIITPLFKGLMTDNGNLTFQGARETNVFKFIGEVLEQNPDFKLENVFKAVNKHPFMEDQIIVRKKNFIFHNVEIENSKNDLNKKYAYLIYTPEMLQNAGLNDPNEKLIFLMNNWSDVDTKITSNFLPQDQKWKFSLRSETFNVKDICTFYGGNGHQFAGGFEIESNDIETDIQIIQAVITNIINHIDNNEELKNPEEFLPKKMENSKKVCKTI